MGRSAGAPEATLAPLIHLGSQFPGRWEDFAEGLVFLSVKSQDSRASDASQANHTVEVGAAHAGTPGLTLFWESGSGSLGCWKAVSVAASLVAAQATTRAEIAPGAGPVNPRPPTLPVSQPPSRGTNDRIQLHTCREQDRDVCAHASGRRNVTLSRCDSFPSRAKHSDRHLILVPYQYVN